MSKMYKYIQHMSHSNLHLMLPGVPNIVVTRITNARFNNKKKKHVKAQ